MKNFWVTVFSAIRTPDTVRRIKNADFLFFSSDADKSDVLAGKHFDRILDPLIEQMSECGWRCESLAIPYSTIQGDNCWSFTHTINRSALVAGILDSFLILSKFKPTHLRMMYLRILKQVSPRAIFCIDAPTALCKAAHELGIPIVEVLHGLGYVNVFDSWSNRERLQLPTHVLSFDSVSTKTFQEYPVTQLTVLQTRKLWNIDFIRRHDPFSPPSTRDPSKKQVLFSLQWDYFADEAIESSQAYLGALLLPRSVLRAVEATQGVAEWHFRLHPAQLNSPEQGEIKRELNTLLGDHPNAEWEVASATPLPVLLESVTHHITMMSMVTVQASEAGIPTLLLCPTLKEGGKNDNLFTDLREAGIATWKSHESEPGSIIEWLEEPTVSLVSEDDFETVELSDVVALFAGFPGKSGKLN